MDALKSMLDHVLHVDRTLDSLAQAYGAQIYLILFLIVFAETGLVIIPFLPGDSLLFAAGALAGIGTLSYPLLIVIFMGAAFLGDNTNYFIGKFLGPKLLSRENSKFLNRKHLEKTHAFFEKHGGKTIIMARFVPIVRTFAPFVAGIGAMTYPRFLAFSVFSSALWVGLCVTAGLLFGQMEVVKKNFSLVVIAIVLISLLPMVYEVMRHRQAKDAGLVDE
jgi:membrane-associated protein